MRSKSLTEHSYIFYNLKTEQGEKGTCTSIPREESRFSKVKVECCAGSPWEDSKSPLTSLVPPILHLLPDLPIYRTATTLLQDDMSPPPRLSIHHPLPHLTEFSVSPARASTSSGRLLRSGLVLGAIASLVSRIDVDVLRELGFRGLKHQVGPLTFFVSW